MSITTGCDEGSSPSLRYRYSQDPAHESQDRSRRNLDPPPLKLKYLEICHTMIFSKRAPPGPNRPSRAYLLLLEASRCALVNNLWVSMLRSCSRSVQRCTTVALQTRTVCCVRSVARSTSTAPAAAGQDRAAWVPSSQQQQLRFGRRTLATLTDEELRRKMEEFNDMFVTVSTVLWGNRTVFNMSGAEAAGTKLKLKFGHMRLQRFNTAE